jgi:hypothetical protein
LPLSDLRFCEGNLRLPSNRLVLDRGSRLYVGASDAVYGVREPGRATMDSSLLGLVIQVVRKQALEALRG